MINGEINFDVGELYIFWGAIVVEDELLMLRNFEFFYFYYWVSFFLIGNFF